MTEHMKPTLVEKLERILVQTAVSHGALETMSLSEMLYYALVESGDDRGSLRAGALQGA